MEMYEGSQYGTTETYMLSSTGATSNTASVVPLDETSYMGANMRHDLMYDNGLYYNSAVANYLSYSSGEGFDSPGEWVDHHFFGLDGQGIYYMGLSSESMSYLYYPPNYAYAQAPYNSYNPYINGAVISSDGSSSGTQQYVTSPFSQLSVSSPAYIPVAVQPRPEFSLNTFGSPLSLSSTGTFVTRPDNPSTNNTVSLTSASNGPRHSSRNLLHGPSESSVRVSHGPLALDGSLVNASPTEQSLSRSATSHMRGLSSGYRVGYLSDVRAQANTFNAAASTCSGPTALGSSIQIPSYKPGRKFQHYGTVTNGAGTPTSLTEQNRGPRTNRVKGQSTSVYTVRAYTTKTDSTSADDNIVIYSDRYNRENFTVNYPNVKFFVIKSYSEDDVHKSIKYNVWSSTPNGNKRLDSSFMDAQKISAEKNNYCPVFLFFSVNASGQFCGVAEMIGPVDFQKDMDFWQQDKWTGSFPVKWHIIKDVPNSYFRHIILENNENKPVTNSRDTQEIPFIPGTDMLNIFKTSPLRTSILDDFMYYEERQKIMHEDNSRLNRSGFNSLTFYPSFLPRTSGEATNTNHFRPIESQTNNLAGLSSSHTEGEKVQIDRTVVEVEAASIEAAGSSDNHPRPAVEGQLNSKLKGLVIENVQETDSSSSKLDGDHNTKCGESSEECVTPKLDAVHISAEEDKKYEILVDDRKLLFPIADDVPADVVTVGSMRIKVNGFFDLPPSIITVGSIPLETNASNTNWNGSPGGR